MPDLPKLKVILIPQGNGSNLYFRKFLGGEQSEWTNDVDLAMKTSDPDFWLARLNLIVPYQVIDYEIKET